jgi:hypothetical protein
MAYLREKLQDSVGLPFKLKSISTLPVIFEMKHTNVRRIACLLYAMCAKNAYTRKDYKSSFLEPKM